MAPARHLVVFAREPRLGRVKRRLAADIGAVRAWAFYRHTLAELLRRLKAPGRWQSWLAFTPDQARLPAPGWRPLPQGPGDLGARLARVLAQLPPGPVVVVGSDAPEVGPAQIDRAFRCLGDHDWVLGPACDGGYWLIGARRRPAFRPPFAEVRWSGPYALSDTLANLAGRRVGLLEELIDVDSGADLARLRRGSGSESHPARR